MQNCGVPRRTGEGLAAFAEGWGVGPNFSLVGNRAHRKMPLPLDRFAVLCDNRVSCSAFAAAVGYPRPSHLPRSIVKGGSTGSPEVFDDVHSPSPGTLPVADFRPAWGRSGRSRRDAGFVAGPDGNHPRRDRLWCGAERWQRRTAAIQSAIDATAPGDTVRLPGGTFLVSRTIRVKTGVKITGCGREHTILKCQAATPMNFFDLSGVRNVELSHFAIDGGDSVNVRCGVSRLHRRRPSHPRPRDS